MTDDKNQQTPITVQPFDQQSLNSSVKKTQQGSAASRPQGAPAPDGSAAATQPPQPTPPAANANKQASPKDGASDPSNTGSFQAPHPDAASAHTFHGYNYPVPPAPMPVGPPDYFPPYGYDYDPYLSPDGEFFMPDEGKKKGNLLLIGIIACIIAIIILILALLIIEFKPFGLFSDDFVADPPSELQIQTEFDHGTLPKPDVEVFKYVDTSGLERTNLGEYEAGVVQYAGTGPDRKASCEAKAEATYENENIMIVQPLYITMTYDKSTQSWTGGAVRSGTIEAVPLSAPDPSLIGKNISNILKSYDPSLSTLYADAEVTEESTLNDNGGTIVFTLTKANGDAAADGTDEQTPPAEGAEGTPENGANNPLVCTVNCEISWNDGLGWVVKVVSVYGDINTGEESQSPENPPADNANPQTPPANNGGSSAAGSAGSNGNGNGGGQGNNNGNPTTITTETEVQVLQLVCNTGDLVEIPGTIHFDNGKILLRTDDEIRVIYNGTAYTTNYFELQGAGSWTNGQHTVIIGTLTANGTMAQAPLILSF